VTARDRQRVPSGLTADKGCRIHIRTRALIELSQKLFTPAPNDSHIDDWVGEARFVVK
jgi:hypothetical protein